MLIPLSQNYSGGGTGFWPTSQESEFFDENKGGALPEGDPVVLKPPLGSRRALALTVTFIKLSKQVQETCLFFAVNVLGVNCSLRPTPLYSATSVLILRSVKKCRSHCFS